ncbi:MAG: ubiquinol-cytochrome c reductase iron-sulfur subunit [Betaproteobacteria bacterium]|nr:ubiquinol-cytochrome c reductase iron-sulfur subunit [Betaproteobacteria bacterium]
MNEEDAPPRAANLRRRRLVAATSAAGAVGVVGAAIPFLASMAPSERARSAGAPVEADLSRVGLGELATVAWRGRPVWILHRTPEMIERLSKNGHLLLDPESGRGQQPDYARNVSRAIKPEYLVLVAICTHLGCVPTFRKDVAPADLGPDWPGGFYCPCHGSRFDLAGRVFKNVPAPLNLEVPRYEYLSDTEVLIGADGRGA